MRWISSEGGPLLLLPKRALTSWNGYISCGDSPAHSPRGRSDYERACEVNSYTGIIPVQMEEALVLGEPMQTTWLSVAGNVSGMLVQWLYADDEPSAIRHAQTVPDNLFISTGLVFRNPDPELYLFDSAIPGKSLGKGEGLLVELKPGHYHIETATYKPDESTGLVIHRLVKSKYRERKATVLGVKGDFG
jgi:hypothetical protein